MISLLIIYTILAICIIAGSTLCLIVLYEGYMWVCGDLFRRKRMNKHWLEDRYKDKTDDELTIDMVFVNEQEQKYIAAELLRREKENDSIT